MTEDPTSSVRLPPIETRSIVEGTSDSTGEAPVKHGHRQAEDQGLGRPTRIPGEADSVTEVATVEQASNNGFHQPLWCFFGIGSWPV